MSLKIDIALDGGEWPEMKAIERIAGESARHCLATLNLEDAESELSILLVDDAEIAELNDKWRNQNKPTNVLSFPAFPIAVGQRPGPMMGDIVLASETIQREARNQAINQLDHLTHLIVHGILHLLGYDHENDIDAEQMEALETEILAQMGIKDPYTMPISDS